MFFLSEIDPRAAIKGSRDPLGLQAVWSHFGREVVGNLTTVTTSVRNFTTLLLGLHFSDEVISSGKIPEEERANAFLKFEQLAAYSRYAYGIDDGNRILGITRVTKRLGEGDKVLISAKPSDQILSNQKTYGIWGLYKVAASRSGLTEANDNRLTRPAQEMVETEYLPRLSSNGGKGAKEIQRFLTTDGFFEPTGKHRNLARSLAGILGPALSERERTFYEGSLVRGQTSGADPTFGRQNALWETICDVNGRKRSSWDKEFDYEELLQSLDKAKASGRRKLAEALAHIRALEPLLVASTQVFSLLINRNKSRLGDVANEIRKVWGKKLSHLRMGELPELAGRIASAARLLSMAEGLVTGDYATVIKLALEQNAAVMKDRGGASWITLERDRFNVRLREERQELFAREELPTLWFNSYFINSLKTVGSEIGGRN